jgi:hypothetical protein
MMAAFILVFSVVTLGMFFVSYCRSLTASTLDKQLSDEVRDITGIRERASSRDYERVLQILQLCPDRPDDRSGLGLIAAYYGLLDFMDTLVSRVSPSFHSWAEQERAGCAQFVAVALDRRIAFSREMLAQQAEL